jgi:hypothetical protein
MNTAKERAGKHHLGMERRDCSTTLANIGTGSYPKCSLGNAVVACNSYFECLFNLN